MELLILIIVSTTIVSAQSSWQQNGDFLTNINTKLLGSVPNPTNENQKIQPSSPWTDQRVLAAKVWEPPASLGSAFSLQPKEYAQLHKHEAPARQKAFPPKYQKKFQKQEHSRSHQHNKNPEPVYKQKLKSGVMQKQHHQRYQPQVAYDPFGQHQPTRKTYYSPSEKITYKPKVQSNYGMPVLGTSNPAHHGRKQYVQNSKNSNLISRNPQTQATESFTRATKTSSNVREIPEHPLLRNYRDDKLHEPQADDIQYEREEPEFDREQAEREHSSPNENYEVPTKPIYPGEGQWAKRGRKHRPFIRPEKPIDLEEDEDVPDGYDTFVEGQKVFEKTKQKLSKEFSQVPQKHGLGKFLPEKDEEEEDSNHQPFVPLRLYAQVRRSEDEKHLPKTSAPEDRLKELVKDSKIHTVYSEEGYEDDAYDHAGHEKNAETGEAFEEAGKLHDQKVVKKVPQKILEQLVDDIQRDAVPNADSSSSSSQPVEVYGTKVAANVTEKLHDGQGKEGLMTMKQNKTLVAANVESGKLQMEIEDKVEVALKPENSTEVKQYVKPAKIHKVLKPKHSKAEASVVAARVPLTKVEGSKLRSTATAVPLTTATTANVDILIEDIPATTQGTTAIPRRNEIKVATITKLSNEGQHFLEPGYRKRRKRNLFGSEKYPYYERFRNLGLDEGSPLRYAENVKNIPDKTRNNLAFYRQAESRYRCPDVEESVNPVPSHVKESAEEGETEELDENEDEEDQTSEHKPPSKRLNGLGDKIDCLKAKYFGENPFDSPFFSEPEVGEVEPKIKFSSSSGATVPRLPNQRQPYSEKEDEQERKSEKGIQAPYTAENYKRYTANTVTQDVRATPTAPANTISLRKVNIYPTVALHTTAEKIYNDDESIEENEVFSASAPMQKVINGNDTKFHENKTNKALPQTETVTNVPVSLLTTPKYTIDLKPKHIYHQIQLLSYLPGDNDTKPSNASDTVKTLLSVKKGDTSSASEPRANASVKIVIALDSNRREPKILIEEKSPKIEVSGTEQDLPKAQAWRRIRIKHNRPVKTIPPSRTDRISYSDDELQRSGVLSRINIRQSLRKKLIPPPKRNAFPTPSIQSSTPYPIIYPKDDMQGGFKPFTIPLNYVNLHAPTQISSSEKPKSSSTPYPVVYPTRSTYNYYSVPYLKSLERNVHRVDSTDSPVSEHVAYPTQNTYSQYSIPHLSLQDSIKVRIVRPTYQVFDINKYLPTTPSPVYGDLSGAGTAQIPKYKIISEVYYKDDIKPNEQLMLLTDIMNNIRNSSQQEIEDSSDEPSDTIPVILKNIARSPDSKSKNKVEREFRRFSSSTTSTSKPAKSVNDLPARHDILSKTSRSNSTVLQRIPGRRIKIRKKRLKTKTNPTTNLPKHDTTTASATEVVDLTPPKISTNNLNKYYVQGMRPPPQQKLHMYSDYIGEELKRMKTRNHRTKRSPPRPYAALSRTRSRESATTSSPESHNNTNDYIPNRSRNYHYDPETGRIVYHNVKKPQEEEEIIYEEVTEALIPLETEKPKQNPMFATATPPPEGQSYVDFVKKLKSAENYQFIPDPTTTEKSTESKVLLSAELTTLKPISTTPPEFLSILSKVRNSSGYKPIEATKATTTQKPDEQDEPESDKEAVQNAPGGMGAGSFQIFDITDYIPRIKHYLPVTGVDTSKYTTIQRPKGDATTETKTSTTVNITEVSDNAYITVTENTPSAVDATSNVPVEITTALSDTAKPTRRRRRRKGRKGRNGRGRSNSAIEVLEASQEIKSGESDPQRAAVSTEKFIFDTVDTATKSVVRRSENSDFRFQKLFESDQPSASKIENKREENESKKEASKVTKDDMYVVLIKPYGPINMTQRHHIVEPNGPEAVTQPSNANVGGKPVEVFQPYNPTTKTGGNYKAQQEAETSSPEKQSTDFRKYIDVFQQYDPEKKTGGNYKGIGSYIAEKIVASETTEQPMKQVEGLQQYDPKKKAGGNYEALEKEELISKDDDDKDVEVVQQFDPTKKTGGGYKAVELEEKDEKSVPIDVSEKPVTIFQPHNNDEKTGGNYKSVIEAKQAEDEFEKAVEVYQPYNTNQRTGGNYKSEHGSEGLSVVAKRTEQSGTFEEPIATETQYPTVKRYGEITSSSTVASKTTEVPLVINLLSTFDKPVLPKLQDRSIQTKNKKRKNMKSNKIKSSVVRLSDVVPKPESYYTDPNLPKAVNMLLEVDLPREEIEKIVEGKDPSEDISRRTPTKAELSRAKVGGKAYKKAKEASTVKFKAQDTPRIIELGPPVEMNPNVELESIEEIDKLEDRKEAEESQTVTEKQKIDDREDIIETEIEETDIEEPYEELPSISPNERKTSFKEEFTPLDDDHEHEVEDEVEDIMIDEERASSTTNQKFRDLPPIIKDPSKRFYYFLPA